MAGVVHAHEFTRRSGEVYLGDIFLDPGVTQLGDLDLEVVEYRAVEDPDGTYWGWKEPGAPIDLIRETREFLSGCFPYGMDIEIREGRGEAVRLRIEPTGRRSLDPRAFAEPFEDEEPPAPSPR